MNDAKQGRTDLIKNLRARVRGSVRPDGIMLVWASRYEESARDVKRIVETLGGEAEVRKVGKARNVGAKTWRVDFTISCPLDAYAGGSMGLRDALAWEREIAAQTAA